MTRRILSVFGAALVALILAGFNHTQQQGEDSSENLKLRPFPSILSPNLPYDVDETMIDQMMAMVHPKNGGEYSAEDASRVIKAQREFDILSWQAFLALNWPHKTYDVAEPTVNDPHGEPLWSYWIPKEKIFLPNGAKPDYPWDAEKAAQNIAENGLKLTMVKAAWRQDASATDNFQAFSGPLVDQNGKWARYEAMVNPEEFDYIYSNTLYSLDGQIAFSGRDIDHNEVTMPVNEGKQRHGAIEIKLAWKELGPNDDPSRFYTKKVRVKVSGPAGNGQDEYRTIPAGLVGMHIAMHTQSSPEWIWSTFEQIDNVRQNPLEHGGMSHANFMNPDLKNATVNVLPPKNGDCNNGTNCQTWYENLTTTPVQVTRVEVPTQPGLNPLDERLSEEAKALNAQVQELLRRNHSVFQYYELIGTQWPVHRNAPAFAGGQGSAPESITNKTPGDVVPVFLVNTTMETYFQKGPQAAGCLEQDNRLTDNCQTDSTPAVGTESCAGCHYSAGIAVGYKRDVTGKPVLANGVKVPIYGENGHFGRSAHGNFSWMLQIETSNQNVGTAMEKKPRSKANPNQQP
ncbi:MAG TPA: hypothetical protein VMT53_00370 [Terriglobales bacterium]|nr:hypothetical protein [Terriglobales bacterium]